MGLKTTLQHLTAAVITVGLMGVGATAQDFSSSSGFTSYVQRTCSALAGQQDDLTSTQSDLFFRCNGALNAPMDGADGLSSRGDILEQYLGLQGVSPQSDGFNRVNRPDQIISARMDVIANQARGGALANIMVVEPILLAQNDPDSIPISSSVSRAGRFDGFVTLGGFQTDQDTSSDELGYEQDGFWIAAGLDYNFSDSVIAGAALSYTDTSADFSSVGGLNSGGTVDTQSWSFSLYGVYLASNALEFNGLISFGQMDFDTTRQISITDKNNGSINTIAEGDFATVRRAASANSEADTIQISLGTSYLFDMGNGVTITPEADISYYHADIGGFTESGSQGLDLIYDDQEVNSTQLSVGATVSRAFSQDWAVLVPYARGRAIFELQDGEQSVRVRYAAALSSEDSFVLRTNPADESSFEFGVGASAQFANGFSGFAEFSTVTGLENVDYQAFSVGIRFEF